MRGQEKYYRTISDDGLIASLLMAPDADKGIPYSISFLLDLNIFRSFISFPNSCAVWWIRQSVSCQSNARITVEQ